MKERKRYALIGVGAAVAGISFILLGFYLDEKGFAWCFPVCTALAVFCGIIEIIGLVKGSLSTEELIEQATTLTLTRLSEVSKEMALETLQKQGFHSLSGEVLARKGFWSVVSYCACWASMENDTDEAIVDTVSTVVDVVTALEQREPELEKSNRCLFLFLESEGVSEITKQTIYAVSKIFVSGSFLRPFKQVNAIIIILVDRTTGQSTFWSRTRGINAYAFGCRLLNKYFHSNTVTTAGRRHSSGA